MCTAARKKKTTEKTTEKINQKKDNNESKKKIIGLAIRGINKTLLVYSALGFELFNLGLCKVDTL